MQDLIFYKKGNNKKLTNIGNYNSDDRFYSYLNKEIEDNLSKSNKFIKMLIGYLFSSTNYKHDPYLKRRFSIGSFLFDFFCILCLIGFVVCLITGVLSPLIKFMNSTDPNKTLTLSALNWVLTSFAILFMIISIFYLVLVFKFRNVNKGLQLPVYVHQKLNMILNLKKIFRIKTLKKTKKNKKQKLEQEQDVLLFDNAQNSNMNTIWLSLQILNLMAYLFNDVNIAICLRNMSEIETESWSKIVKQDFENIELNIEECEYKNLAVTVPSYTTATYYALPVAKSSMWNYVITILFAGIFGSTLTNLFN